MKKYHHVSVAFATDTWSVVSRNVFVLILYGLKLRLGIISGTQESIQNSAATYRVGLV